MVLQVLSPPRDMKGLDKYCGGGEQEMEWGQEGRGPE